MCGDGPAFTPPLTTCSSTRGVNEDAQGVMRKYYYTVITLTHKEARPNLRPRSIRDAGLSAGDAAFIEVRVLLTALPGRTQTEKGVLIVNVYQYQAVDIEHQARLLRILDSYLR